MRAKGCYMFSDFIVPINYIEIAKCLKNVRPKLVVLPWYISSIYILPINYLETAKYLKIVRPKFVALPTSKISQKCTSLVCGFAL